LLLKIQNLKTYYTLRREHGRTPTVKAVDDVTLAVDAGEILGLVGESGCGKSTLARSIVRLTAVSDGSILFDGRDLTALRASELQKARTEVQMIFQDPYASLNPRMTVFDALAEPLLVHGLADKSHLPEHVAELMTRVGLEPQMMHKFPHEFSGGQRQRIAIARALAVRPQLLIADEPVSALDVSIQAQILNLLIGLCRDMNMAMLFISHDLSVVQHIADRVAVMYLGRIMEIGPAEALFQQPLHPYTKALMSAIPLPDPARERAREPIEIEGEPPSPVDPPPGCPFHTRCPISVNACREAVPALAAHGEQHAACIQI
jgi:oligopeptide/dipeptide ABC transporter ATP-binding protein